MRAVEMLDTQELIRAIAELKIAAALSPRLPRASGERLAALLMECRRRRLALQRPASPYALSLRRPLR
ncbi:MAG TPA: hypothetical protein VIL85_11935 [Thermomicrobiales bacterium]|jgi:hypothetical protein